MFKIIVEDDIHMEESSDIIDSPFYIQCEEFIFPCNKWIDFTYPVLEEWKWNLIKCKEISRSKFILYFHEGSYWLEICKTADNMYINFMDNKSSVKYYECDYISLVESLYVAYKDFAKILYKNDVYGARVQGIYNQIVSSIKELKILIKSLKKE